MPLGTHLFLIGWIDGSPSRLVLTLTITIVFAAFAFLVRAVSPSGSIVGSAVCFLLLATLGPPGFAALATVFVLAWLSTRFGYARKLERGTAEKRGGRTASQVAANLAVATCCSILYVWFHQLALIFAGVAALAEAAADTVSSEFGQAYSSSARLITNGSIVPAGTNGGVTLAGSLAGIAASLVVACVCAAGGLIPWNSLWLAGLAGVLGMVADSYLGAWFEQRGRLNNDAVNFTGTLFAAIFGGVGWLIATGY